MVGGQVLKYTGRVVGVGRRASGIGGRVVGVGRRVVLVGGQAMGFWVGWEAGRGWRKEGRVWREGRGIIHKA